MKEYVCITGGSSGIGLGLVEKFLESEYRVITTVRTKSDQLRLEQRFDKNLHVLNCDVTNHSQVIQAGKDISRITGNQGLSLLINNAGIVQAGPLMYLPIPDLRKQLEVNVIGLMDFTQASFDSLRRHSHPKIMNVGSISGIITFPFSAAYAASKHAVEAISDGLRMELKPFNIKVILIQPGAIKTPIWSKSRNIQSKFESTPYGKYMEMADSEVDKIEKSSLPVDYLTEQVLKISRYKNPKDRYIIAKHSWLYKLIAYWIPTRLVDYLMTRKRLLS